MNNDFDICIITFNNLENDARALNLALAIHDFGLKLFVISIKDNSNIEYPFHSHQLNLVNNANLYRKIFDFNLQAINYLKKFRFKSIICSDLYCLPIAYQLKSKYNFQLIYDSREIYSALGPLHKKPLKQMFWTHLENFLVEKVDDIIISGELDGQFLKEYFKKQFNYHLIMNLPPYKETAHSNKIRNFYKIDDSKKILIYQGMLLEGRGIEEAIEAMKDIDAFLIIIGDGSSKAKLVKLVENLNLNDRVKFLGLIPYNELHEWTCSADIGLALFLPISFSYELALPNKIFEYMMAGIPSISSNLQAIKDLNDKYSITHLVDQVNKESIINAFKFLMIDKNYQIIADNCIKNKKTLSYQAQYDTIKGLLKI